MVSPYGVSSMVASPPQGGSGLQSPLRQLGGGRVGGFEVWGGACQRDSVVPLMTQLLKSCIVTSAIVFWLSLLQCPTGFQERGTEAPLLVGVSMSHSL